MTSDIAARLHETGIVPVVEIDHASAAANLAKALADGGIPLAEITFRTPAAADAIAMVAAARPDFLVGAGTVLDVVTVDAAAEAGANFVVSPGFNAEVASRARSRGLFCVPGAATATEIQACLSAGFSLIKLFPVRTMGGVDAVRAFAGPFSSAGARFLPTGGVTPDNASLFLAEPLVVAVGGSWVAPRALIRDGAWSAITERAASAVELARQSRAEVWTR